MISKEVPFLARMRLIRIGIRALLYFETASDALRVNARVNFSPHAVVQDAKTLMLHVLAGLQNRRMDVCMWFSVCVRASAYALCIVSIDACMCAIDIFMVVCVSGDTSMYRDHQP